MTIQKISEPVTFTRAKALSSSEIYIACSPDGNDVGYPFSRVSQLLDGNWDHRDYDFWVSSLANYQEDQGVPLEIFVIGETGQASTFRNPVLRELIVDLNPDRPKDGPRLGYLLSANQIGTHLYACGDGGQTYKRYQNGMWSVLDKILLDGSPSNGDWMSQFQDNPDLLDDPEKEAEFDKLLLSDTALGLQYITGLSEDSLYVCGGKGNIASEFMRWNGTQFDTLLAPPDEREEQYTPSLNHILFEDGEDKIRVCGQQGAMLVGNAADGFVQDPAAFDTEILYYNMARFHDQIYLATNLGLHVHDGNQIIRVRTGLEPDALDTHTVQAVDGVLWVVGSKDILRFDGNTWERIQYPTNPPI